MTINDVPTPASTYLSYTFTFIIPTTNGSNYITGTSGFTVNGTALSMRGNTAIAGNLSPSAMIMQQVTIFYFNGSFYGNAITTATAV